MNHLMHHHATGEGHRLRASIASLALTILVATGGCRKPNAAPDPERDTRDPRKPASSVVPIPQTSSVPLLIDDKTVRMLKDRISAVRGDFSAFSSEEIMELISAPDPRLNGMQPHLVFEYGQFLSRMKDPKLLAAHIQAFVDNSALIAQLYEIGEHSPAVTPETLESIIASFKLQNQLTCFSNGLKNRIENVEDKNARLKLATRFLEATDNPEITENLLGAIVIDMVGDNPQDLERWLQDLPDEVASTADWKYIEATFSRDPDAAIRYAQSLLDSESQERAGSALLAVVDSFGEQNGKKAFKWTLSLPLKDDLEQLREKALSSAYQHLKPEDRKAAKQRVVDLLGETKVTEQILKKFEEFDALIEENHRRMRELQSK